MVLQDEFLFGVVGGVFAVSLNLWKWREAAPNEFPEYFSRPFYWVVSLLMIMSGGMLALIYAKSGITLSPLLAVNVGASAPLILGSMTASAPNVTR